ncbi:unnamed protein product [Lactuca saligna]|uniref:Uncharacterized protein n=1 Tax=Lactuca saligna TaxID=75948 RepID=A0AA35Z3B6_LACSI|nr:unnamed protein product [Lactuca saligna]
MAFSERVTGSDCASPIDSKHLIHHSSQENLFCTILVHYFYQRAITKLKLRVMQDALMSNISTLHTTGIIVAYISKFAFVGPIHEAMLRHVPPTSKVLDGYRIIPTSRFCPLTPEHYICIEEDQHVRNEEDPPFHNEEEEPVHNEFVPSPPPSPKNITTSTPINIALCPPPVSFQP